MKVCSSCERTLFSPIIAIQKEYAKCELCWEKHLVRKVLVGK